VRTERWQLGSSFAESDELAADGNAARDFDMKQSFERAEFTGAGDGEAEQELLEGIFAADRFDGSLRAHRGGAREN
jgi:hypothetical protein